jgi:hypothetical protein
MDCCHEDYGCPRYDGWTNICFHYNHTLYESTTIDFTASRS